MTKLEYVLKPVAELTANPRNARTHSKDQIKKIAASIKEFGFIAPAIIDKDGVLVAGHGRLEAAKKLKMTEIPCVIADHLTPEQLRAYMLMDNRSAMDAGWDDEILKIELSELASLDFDLSFTGFDVSEVSSYVRRAEVDEKEDDVPEPPPIPKSKLGDIWLLGNNRLMCGDSTSKEQVEILMDGKKADMVFTDPPYGVDYEGISNDTRAGLTDLLENVFCNYVYAARKGASVYVFHSDRCADIFHNVFRNHFHFSSMVIWVKPSIVLSQTDYQSRHEPCLYGWIEGAAHSWNSDRKQTSIWEFGKENVQGHTTPKPVAMISYAVENSSKEESVVVDFFGGSGSTLIACEKTNRQCYMMELEPHYIDVIIKRWQDYTGQDAVHAETGKTYNEA